MIVSITCYISSPLVIVLISIQQYQLYIITCLFLIFGTLCSADNYGSIGENYGRIADNLPQPSRVVELLKSNGITRVKIFDAESSVLSALANSNISVTVCMPNGLLSSAANDQSFTDSWLNSNIVPFCPRTMIEAIAVGNEVFVDPQSTPYLVPAMKNMYASLQKLNFSADIKVSSPVALSALQNSYPPSSGSFKSELIEPAIKPMLTFLQQTGSYLMANSYPFFAYEANTDTISLDYALLRPNEGVKDSANGNVYMSLFEAQLDAVFAALDALNFSDIKVVVSETGWPSAGGDTEFGAGIDNAAAYNGNLVRRVLTGGGTPLRPNDKLNVFLFALFNENQKGGPVSERNYGLFYPDTKKVYDIPLSLDALNGTMSNPTNRSKAKVPIALPRVNQGPSTKGQTWCVANVQAGQEKLQSALDYACGEGGADCRPIQSGERCFHPDTLEAHASYAFNSYYQKMSRASWTCYFGGAANVVTQLPSKFNCEYPTMRGRKMLH
ncbi:Glucan endo-1,3-beta-D-glucosidase [Heracleum sosnowskyi]|uniref:glucan endo-1,3-beta-D-glucosidase n=1 Tax=Heracleum sosnowskyi TaxID=360622 RepID=A0AAD8GT71_9APIA|nr:Glucan endo-1,3-beta-D-glucosidase [Heracleum sosnowskyi]